MALQLAKLFSRINFNGPLPTTRPELGPCWIWLGSTDKDGYGRITFDGKIRRVHRVTYTLVKGNIPEESEPDNLCRVRACGNPSISNLFRRTKIFCGATVPLRSMLARIIAHKVTHLSQVI
jgi:hypothetical protein